MCLKNSEQEPKLDEFPKISRAPLCVKHLPTSPNISQHLPTSSLHRSALHSSSQPRVVIVTGTAWSLKTRSAKMGCRDCGFSKRLRGSEWRRQKKYEKADKLIRIDQTLNFVRTCWTMPSKCMQNAPNDACQDPVRSINKQKADFVDSLIPLD